MPNMEEGWQARVSLISLRRYKLHYVNFEGNHPHLDTTIDGTSNRQRQHTGPADDTGSEETKGQTV